MTSGTAAAEPKPQGAQAKRHSGAVKRAQADRTEQLAQVEKKQRKP
jgi:hypothetical protein